MKVHKKGIWGLITLAMLFILSGCGSDSDSTHDDVSENSAWMDRIAPVIENQKLNYIALPGTHDSGTYNINGNSAFADDGNPHPCKQYVSNTGDDIEHWLKDKLGDRLGGKTYNDVVKPLVNDVYNDCNDIQADWSRSQTKGIYDQLNDGIRYIDLRVLQDNGAFYVIHSLVSINIDTALKDIKRFYSNPDNNKEILILDINHTYHMDDAFDKQLISLIKDILKDSSGNSLLIPRCSDWNGSCSQPMDLTIKNRWSRSTSERIIVLYKPKDESTVTDDDELWHQSSIISHWPDITSIETLNKHLMSDAWNDQDIRDLQANGGFYVLQSIRTATNNVIYNSIETTLWKKDDFSGHKIIGKYAKEIYDHYGWCTNCPTSLLQFGDETNQGVNRINLPEKIFGQRANIIIVDDFANPHFQWGFQEDNYDYVSAVIQMNISRYCNKWMGLFSTLEPDEWFGYESQGGGMAVGDIGGSGAPDLVVFHIDHPSGGNHGWYRIGWDIGQDGIIASWTDPSEIPGRFGGKNQGGGIAVGDINGKGGPDLVVFHIDHPSGGNHGYYRIGWDISQDGVVTKWTDPIEISGWFGSENQGGGIAVGDIDNNSIPDLVVFHIDHPSGGNHGWYRIGWDIGQDGIIASWTDPSEIPGWFGGKNQGGGIALGDINGNGILDLMAFNVDHPSGGNHGWYRIGLDMNPDGTISGSRCPSPF